MDCDTGVGTTAGTGLAGVDAGIGVATVVGGLAVGIEAAAAADVLAGMADCIVWVELEHTMF